MAEIKQVLVPDIGDYKDVDIIEVMVKAGDTIKAEDNLTRRRWMSRRPTQAWSRK